MTLRRAKVVAFKTLDISQECSDTLEARWNFSDSTNTNFLLFLAVK